MKFLLDTHVLLWWLADDRRLSQKARKLIATDTKEILFSAASGWELAIKASIGKLELPANLTEFLEEQLVLNNIETLAVSMKHATRVRLLPPHHSDPFDRLLVAQAQIEGLILVTADRYIRKYDCQTIW